MKLYNLLLKTVVVIIFGVFVFYFVKFTDAYLNSTKYTYLDNNGSLRIDNSTGRIGAMKMDQDRLIFSDLGTDSVKKTEH